MAIEDFEEIMNLQRQLASRVVQENEMDMQLRLLEIINSLVKGRTKQIQKAMVLQEALMEGIPDDQAERLLKSLEDLGYIKHGDPGYIRTT